MLAHAHQTTIPTYRTWLSDPNLQRLGVGSGGLAAVWISPAEISTMLENPMSSSHDTFLVDNLVDKVWKWMECHWRVKKEMQKGKRYYFDAPQQMKYLCLCLTHQNGHLSRLKSLGASSLVFPGSVSIGKRGMFLHLHFARNIPTCHLLPTERLQGTTVYHSDLWYHFASHHEQ